MAVYFPYKKLQTTTGNVNIIGAVDPEQGFGTYSTTTVEQYNTLKSLFYNWDDNVFNVLKYVEYNGSGWQFKSGYYNDYLLLTLPNGNYITLYNGGYQNSTFGFSFYFENGTKLTDAGADFNSDFTSSNILCASMFLGIKNNKIVLYLNIPIKRITQPGYLYSSFYFDTDMTDGVHSSSGSIYFDQFFGSPFPPEYSWTAWDQISGNSGQYRCQLSKLSDTALKDISVQISQPESIFNRLSTRSSIWSTIQNAQLGKEKIVMWSGRNWCSMTMTAGGVSGNYVLTFKFYNPNMSETTPFYTYTEYIVYSPSSPNVNTDSNLLLSFAYDSEQQAAVFLPIVYRAGGIAQGYAWGLSSQNTPSEDQMLYLYLWLQESGAGTPEYPYDTGTEDNGGNPRGPQPGDHMPAPGVPTLSAMSSKMFTVYCPTDEQLEDIAEYLWSSDVITNIQKYFNNFSDNIIALYVLPHQPANLPTKNFTVGNLQSETITGVKYVTSRFVDVDMGSVTVTTTYDSYLDFSPFTRFEIYLPGVGMQTLSADDIMCPTDPDTGTLKPVEESTISVKYTLDLMTGLLVAFVFVNGEMRYQFPGKIGYSIPITGENYTRMVTGAISAMAGLVGAAATGGLTAPLAAGSVAAAVSGTVNAMKPDVHRSGNLSGDVSMLSEESPYLIYHRPNKPLLENQERYTGFPSYKSGALSEFSGLTQVIDAHIEGISCTEAERAEILNLLKSGVIL